jgi:hypothetical protein
MQPPQTPQQQTQEEEEVILIGLKPCEFFTVHSEGTYAGIFYITTNRIICIHMYAIEYGLIDTPLNRFIYNRSKQKVEGVPDLGELNKILQEREKVHGDKSVVFPNEEILKVTLSKDNYIIFEKEFRTIKVFIQGLHRMDQLEKGDKGFHKFLAFALNKVFGERFINQIQKK